MKIFVSTKVDLSLKSAEPIHLVEVADNLRRLGCDVTVFAPRTREDPIGIASHLRVIYLPNLNIPLLRALSIELSLFFYLLLYAIKFMLWWSRNGSTPLKRLEKGKRSL